jgi:hypothetical protein
VTSTPSPDDDLAPPTERDVVARWKQIIIALGVGVVRIGKGLVVGSQRLVQDVPTAAHEHVVGNGVRQLDARSELRVLRVARLVGDARLIQPAVTAVRIAESLPKR